MAEYNPSKIIKDGNTYNFRDTTKIPLAGSNEISGSLIPSATDTYNLGGPSYQWNNAYIKSLTINGVACGDILTHNASEFVLVSDLSTVATSGSYDDLSNKPATMTPTSHTHGNITNDGKIGSNANKPLITTTGGTVTTGSFGTTANTFCEGNDSRLSDARTPTAHTHSASDITSGLATVATSGSYNDLSNKPTIPTVNNGTLTIQQNGTTVDTFTANSSSDKTVNIQCVDLTNNQTVGGDKEFTGTTTAHDIVPSATNTYNFGSSTNKWKTLNGINPGALSLPSNSYVNVDTTTWDLTCSNGKLGSFTPTADGWLMLQVNNNGSSEVNFWVIGGVIRINNKSTISTSTNSNFNLIIIPVGKGNTYNIHGNASEYVAGRSISYCRFMPCRGNI